MRNHTAMLLAGAAFCLPAGAFAQAVPVTSDPAVAPPPQATPAGDRRIFTPADFARFAPKSAYDMLVQIPGFTVRGADQERGLGQASENVLVNGQRIADKSGGAIAELQRMSAANVERIEIVEAAQLGIAGLSGQVANVVVKATAKASGQFEWRPDVRPHYSHPNLLRGSVSFSDRAGPLDYTLSINNGASRGAYGGPAIISDRFGAEVERREQVISSDFDQPRMAAKFKLDAPESSIANLTVAHSPYWYDFEDDDRRIRADGDDRTRRTTQTQIGYVFDITGDYDFAVGPGRLKFIGLRKFEHEPTRTRQVTRFDSGAPAVGVELLRDVHVGETIGRAEYAWKSGKNDWQLSLERASNRLEQEGSLSILSPSGSFDPVDYPEGSGIVSETRYEGVASFSRPLTPKLDLQLTGGGEISRIQREDIPDSERKFFRPKGSLSLAWRPSKSWDASFKLRRRVGQISFYDFLAQRNFGSDRENAGNPDLVPPQSWEIETEVGRDFGAWGKSRLKLYGHRIDDIIDIVPIGETGQAIGNLPRATRLGLESTSTIQFDNLGLKGAKIDLVFGFERTRVRDPLTGERRAISGTQDRWAEISFRHDVAGTKWAYGASANHGHVTPTYFLTEIARGWEGPVFADVFVEHKDVYGLTVRASAGNLLNARHRYDRIVYGGRRDVSPVEFEQKHDQLIGPIFQLSVKGTF
ncbi:TonB-dependent receptor plug domain-containing protein [Sphingomonas sp. LY29]|uniref:TonB-dependent receptor plug domain-containing protein n=1 Tax=Sphingomonas sp. LY29 TaxID=3095341 RepID=UPI002D7693FC|nr:TonB-dependent receptor plug domain-containing protein [Sphingomonas sp. LY29]WRP26841.1 TonB-dependent receptor plug domain-containing protein [Sphingomonas sp. LY29]